MLGKIIKYLQWVYRLQPKTGTISDRKKDLLEASRAGDLELVKKIVNLHPHIVNCRDLDGRHITPLHQGGGVSAQKRS